MPLILSLILSAILCFWSSERTIEQDLPQDVAATVSLAAPAGGVLLLSVDEGAGFATAPVAGVRLAALAEVSDYLLALRVFSLERLRLTLPASLPTSAIRTVSVCCTRGTQQPVWFARSPDTTDGTAVYALPTPLRIAPRDGLRTLYVNASRLLRGTTAILTLFLLWRHVGRPLLGRSASGQPVAAIFAVASLAVVGSLYPVVFANRSLISPGNGGNWLAYPSPPFVPGGLPTPAQDVRGSDTGATSWQYRSYSVVQAASIVHGEVPLYNRYSNAGTSLIGQGTSQLGDPLQLLTVAADGAGWAWDAKLFLAKILFCAGVGIVVLLATGSLGAALVLTGSAAFIGFFAFRLNHPANFALCYSPWLWVGFALLTTPGADRRRSAGFLLLLLATWMEMNSGAVKEGYVAVLTAYLSGGVMALHQAIRSPRRFAPLSAVAVAGVLIPLVTAPFWLTFIEMLGRSKNYAPNTHVGQLPDVLLPVLAENAFFTAIANGTLGVPSGNLLMALAAIVGILDIGRLLRSPVLTAALFQLLLCLAFAFAVIPPGIVAAIPLIGEIGHVANTFLLSALLPMATLAGHGIAFLISMRNRGLRAAALVVATVLLGCITARYCAQVAGSPGFNIAQFDLPVIVPTALGTAILFLSFLAFPVRRWTWQRAALLSVGFIAAHGAHGFQLRRLHSSAITAPSTRVSFRVPSPGLRLAQSLSRDPYRVAGLDGALFPGYNASLLIESINGPEALISPGYYALLLALGFEDTFHWGWLRLVHSGDLPRLSRALDALNVQALVGPATLEPSSMPDAMWLGSSDLAVIERPSAWPRAFLTDRIAAGYTPENFASRLKMSDGKPFAMLAEVTALPFAPVDPATGKGSVVAAQDYVTSPNSTTFAIDAPKPGLLVLTETDSGDELRATLDGAHVHSVIANGSFQSYIVTKAGRHVLHVAFVPAGWRAGLLLCAAGLGGTVVAGGLMFRARRIT